MPPRDQVPSLERTKLEEGLGISKGQLSPKIIAAASLTYATFFSRPVSLLANYSN
jgi:hypothetical protein